MLSLKQIFFSRTILFVLFALLALFLLGSSTQPARYSDLNRTALQFAEESSAAVSKSALTVSRQHPGAVLRSNLIRE